MIKGFAHVCFVVKDIDRALAFYQDALGFSRAFDFVNDSGRRFGVYLHIGGRTFFELFEGDPEARRDAQSYRHFCLEVDDIEAAVAALAAKGVNATAPQLGSDQSWQSWITDPDGNRIELHAYTAESRQRPHLR